MVQHSMERSSHRHKRSHTPKRRSRRHHASQEHDEYMCQDNSSHRHKRHHTPRRRRREDRHYQSSSGYDDYPQQENSPFRDKRHHTSRRRRSDDELNQNSQINDCYGYEHHEGFTGHHHDDIVPLNHHGNHQNVSLMREQQFTGHMSNSCRCTGDTHYCTCHSCMEYLWRLQRQYYMSRRYHGCMMELAYDPDHDAFHGAPSSQNEDMGPWRKDTDYDFKINRYESKSQASGSGGYSTVSIGK